MKKLLQTLFFFLLVTQIAFAQWELQNPLITQSTLNDVTLIDENTGWAVGDNGTIIKTTNSGIDWLNQQSNTINSLRGVSFVDINNGWAVGENGTVLKTTDGGSNWIMQTSGVTDDLNDVWFTNINTGLVVGEQGSVLKTNDGGNGWIAQTMGNTITLYSVCLIDENNGWVVGDNSSTGHPDGLIKRTTDSGNTWTTQLSPINTEEECLYDVYFTDINTGWIVGRKHDGTNPWGEILKTTNGGSNWIAQICPTQAELSSVNFIDSNNGWATAADRWYGVIKGHILRTTNGGSTWLLYNLGVSKGTNGISFTNSINGLTVGENGTIQLSMDGGKNWNSPPGGSTNDWTDVCFTDPNIGMVIGDGGTILRTVNIGTSWTPVVTGTTNDFTAMCFIDANEGWAVTGIIHGFHTELRDSSFIFHTIDGGVTWTKQITMPLTLFNDVFFVDANNGWVVGTNTDSIWWTSSYSFMLRTNNGGMSWSQTNLDSFPTPIKIQFINTSTGWMLCNSPGMGCWGGLFKTSDSGNTWNLSLDYCWSDFQFNDMNNGIAVKGVNSWSGEQWGIISKTTDGGETWSSDSIYSPAYDVFFVNNNTVATLGHHYGDDVICYWSTDAGSTWISRSTGIYEDMHHIFFTNELNGWMIGNNGAIYHTTNGGVTFVEEEQIDNAPSEFLLSQNYPNPFNPTTKIKYSVPQSSNVIIKVYDLLGNEIETLVNEEKAAGTYELTWNAVNLPSGVYFYQLCAGSFIETKKMLLLK
jgi:photosystem II stability/assembly factor-like uncharacterized protein